MRALVCRVRRAEAHIQLMLWKVNYSDIVFINTVCVAFNSLPLMHGSCLRIVIRCLFIPV